VAITPAAGFVSPLGALALGALATFPSYFIILFRARTRVDDSLDVFAGHGIGGLTGALLTGVFAAKEWGGTDGLLAGNQLGKQALGAGASFVYAGLMTFIILKVLGLVMTLRADQKAEGLGLDVTQHGEEAYSTGEGSILVLPDEITKVTTAPVGVPFPATR
jgi:Amt family ammonium transporter